MEATITFRAEGERPGKLGPQRGPRTAAGAAEGRRHFQKCNSNKTGKYLLLGVPAIQSTEDQLQITEE